MCCSLRPEVPFLAKALSQCAGLLFSGPALSPPVPGAHLGCPSWAILDGSSELLLSSPALLSTNYVQGTMLRTFTGVISCILTATHEAGIIIHSS